MRLKYMFEEMKKDPATKLQLAGLNVRRDTIAKTETGRRWLRDFETALHCFPTEFRQAAPSYFQT